MLTITITEGGTVTGSPQAIVSLLNDSHYLAADEYPEAYMERVKDDMARIRGIDVATDSPEAFLHSLAEHNLLTIKEETR